LGLAALGREAVASGARTRGLFRHKPTGGWLVADAYRGTAIREAIGVFLAASAGNNQQTLPMGRALLGLHGNANLVVYVGHNGLMDFTVEQPAHASSTNSRDAMVLACKSRPYFEQRLAALGCRPVLLTTGFMAPEAYTLDAAAAGWLAREGPAAIRERAAQAYRKYQQCGLDAARKLFDCGAAPAR